jgi:hypothetical protein
VGWETGPGMQARSCILSAGNDLSVRGVVDDHCVGD